MAERMQGALVDGRPGVRAKLSAAWTAVMFLYVYGDIFDLYRARKIEQILAGRTPLGPTTQTALLGFSVMMSIPALMVLLSLLLAPAVSRWANIVLGLAYTAIIVATAWGSWPFIVYLAVLEGAATLYIAWTAWRWPRGVEAG